jgi:hypothetical protein
MLTFGIAARRAGTLLTTVAVIGALASPVAASATETSRETTAVSIVSSQSNLVPAGAQTVTTRESIRVAANSSAPSGYRLYESHFYTKQTCENRGKWLRDVGHNIDNYWCTPVKQDNGRFWLYVYGYCSTDRVINGTTVVKVSDARPVAVASR